MADKMSFVDAMVERRSIYTLTKDTPISDARVKELLVHAARYVPSSFDSQTTRIVALLNDDHDQFWDITMEVLRPHLDSPDKVKNTEGKIQGFRAARGTILFFEDPNPVKEMQTKYAAYADKFPTWATESGAMHQYALWTALEAEGCGANLQHYNPLVDQRVKEKWGINMEWQLKAQLVFGGRAEGYKQSLQAKKVEGREKHVTVHGAK